MVDKYSAMIDYLRQCPAMAGVLGFQTAYQKDGSLRITTTGTDSRERKRYIDGSVLRRFDFSVEFYKTLSYVPYTAGSTSYTDENIQNILSVQSLIEWLDDKMSAGVFPNFGTGYSVESVQSLNDSPNLAWLDAVNYDPPLAKYTVTIRVDYIDSTRAI